jgi:hypothetical protein
MINLKNNQNLLLNLYSAKDLKLKQEYKDKDLQ